MAYLFKHAQKSAAFYFPYFTPDKEFSAALIDAAKRLDITIITNSYDSWDMAKSGYVDQLSHYPDLLKAGIKIYEWQGHAQLKLLEKKGFKIGFWPGNTMHSKIALFDGSVALVGSDNMNSQSLDRNNEVMAMVNDENFAAQIANIFNSDINGVASVGNGSASETLPLVQLIDETKRAAMADKYKASPDPVWSYPLGL